ncbi:Multidrug resistance-associated protein 1, partial [Dinochytrium kinnereticum]
MTGKVDDKSLDGAAETPFMVATEQSSEKPANKTVEKEKERANGLEESAGPSPELSAPLLSRGILEWLTKFMVLASKRVLAYKDLFDIEPRYNADVIGPTIDKMLEDAKKAYAASHKHPSEDPVTGSIDEGLKIVLRNKLLYAVYAVMRRQWFFGAVGCFLAAVAGIMSPVVLQFVIRHLQDTSAPAWKGYMLCVLLFILQVVQSISLNTYRKINTGIGIGLKSAIMNVVFRKSLRLSSVSRQEYANGKIMNFISMDAQVLEYVGHTIHGIWAIPLQVIAMSAVIVVYLGYGGAVGVSFMLCVALSQQFIMKKIFKFESLALKATDARVRLCSEMIAGMKIIKLFAWEDSFLSRIKDLRETELIRQFKVTVFSAIFYGLTYVIPSLVAIVSFSVFSVIPGNTLSPEIVFPALALINLLRVPMMELPQTITLVIEAYVTIGRISRFLAAPELDPSAQPANGDGGNVAITISVSVKFVIPKNATFVWEEWSGPTENKDDESNQDATKKEDKSAIATSKSDEKTMPPSESAETLVSTSTAEEVLIRPQSQTSSTLIDITFEVERNLLTAIVGPVGSGKSSLLQAILGEMPKSKGSVDIFGRIAYSPQQGWLLNTSLKENILFGAPLDQDRYERVLWACALDKDILQFPDGDQTEVGERGVTLSGGQAARVNLARSLYSDADILLLDDPLAAVDAHVGKHIFENAISGPLIQGRTVVLVTHQLHFLPNVDRICYLEGGTILESGTFSTLLSNGARFSKLMAEYGGVSELTEDVSSPTTSTTNLNYKKAKDTDKKEPLDDEKTPKALMVQEEREEGAVRLYHYRIYLYASGGANTFNLTNGQYIGYYSLLGIIQGIGAAILAVLVTYAGLKGARVLHSRALNRMAHAPMSFFDTNPIGRIINRFSRDVAEVDRWLALILRGSLNLWSSVLCNVVLIGYVVPAVFAIVLPIVPIYYYIQKFYRNASRELKRLEAIGRSPLFSQFSETLMGLPTVRAFGSTSRFIFKNQELINVANRPTLLRNYVDIWVSIRAEFFVAIICLAVSCMGLGFRVNPALLGLSVGYTLTLTSSLNFALRLVSEVEGRMNSVE